MPAAGLRRRGITVPRNGPLPTLSEFSKHAASDAIREYLDSSDPDEVVRCVRELKCRPYHPEVAKRAISLGCDEGPRERELVSRLLACLHPDPLTDGEMEAGFGMVLDAIEELTIDIPDAKVRRLFCFFCFRRPCRSVVGVRTHDAASSSSRDRRYSFFGNCPVGKEGGGQDLVDDGPR